MAPHTPGQGAPAPPPVWVWSGALLAALAGIGHLGLLYAIFVQRIGYPYDLEWMEGGMLCHSLRLMQGEALYGPPSADFISYLYTPFYAVLVAGLGKVFGLSYLLGRIVSLLSFSGVLLILGKVIARQSGGGWPGRLWAIAGAGLIACTFQHTGAWFDLVRNDSLYLLLVTAGLYLLRYHHQRHRTLALASLLFGLAFLTKQTASLFIVFSGAALLLLNWRRLPQHVALVGLVAGGTVLLWNHLSDGWFWKYTYAMHQGHDLYWDRIWPVTEKKLLEFSPATAGVLGLWLLVAPAFWIGRRALPPGDRQTLYWFFVALVGVAVSAVGYATQWASYNAFIPGLLFPSAFAALAGADLTRKVAGPPGSGLPRRVAACAVGLLVGGALAGQLWVQRYPMDKHLPGERDRRTGAELIQRLREVKGPVMMPYHPFYPVLAGKAAGYHQMGTNDVTRAGYPLPPDIRARLADRYYGAVVLDNPPQGRYDFIFEQYKLGHYFRHLTVPEVVTGYRVRPTYFFVPKGPDPPPAGQQRIFGFESGTFEGWQRSGEAFGRAPVDAPVWGQGPVGPYEGSYLANSYHGGDIAQGTLLSPEFSVDGPELRYRVGGGHRPGALEVRLLVAGEVVHRGTGTNSDIMELRTVDVSAHRGATMRLELLDRATGAWGHLLFDDLCLVLDREGDAR